MRAVLVSYDASFQLAGFTKLGAGTVACDREYNIYNEDAMTGPMCRTIGGRGDVIGMAFGAVGEASSSVLVHAKACAEAIAPSFSAAPQGRRPLPMDASLFWP